MTTYLFDPLNHAAASAVAKFEAAKDQKRNMVKLSKAELKAWLEDITVLNTSLKPLINSMNDTTVSY